MKSGENAVDVVDVESMSKVCTMKTVQAKCVHLANRQIFVG